MVLVDPVSRMPILMPAPALDCPPTRFHAAGAFISWVALLSVRCICRIGRTPMTPGIAASSASRSGVAETKTAFRTSETELIPARRGAPVPDDRALPLRQLAAIAVRSGGPHLFAGHEA